MMENVSLEEANQVEGGIVFLVVLGIVAIAGFIAGVNMANSECSAN